MTDAEFDRLTADIELTRAELGRTVSELRRQAGPSAQARRIAMRVQAWLRQHPRQIAAAAGLAVATWYGVRRRRLRRVRRAG